MVGLGGVALVVADASRELGLELALGRELLLRPENIVLQLLHVLRRLVPLGLELQCMEKPTAPIGFFFLGLFKLVFQEGRKPALARMVQVGFQEGRKPERCRLASK